MKVTWEEDDIRAGRVVRPASDTLERLMIGFITANPTRYTLNSLSDGMVTTHGTRAQVAEALNRGGYLPNELEARA
jgi:hypothetical protein